MYNYLWPHGLQHARLSCPSPNSQSLLKLMSIQSVMHPTISSSVIPFSSCLQSFPTSEAFPMSQFFASDGQSIGISASSSVLPINIDWFPLGLTGLIPLQSKGLLRVFSNTTVQKHHWGWCTGTTQEEGVERGFQDVGHGCTCGGFISMFGGANTIL